MRTTIRLRDDLLTRARRKALDEGRSLTSVIEEGLVLVLSQVVKSDRRRIEPLVSKAGGGLMPGVDLDNARALLDAMEEG